MSFSARRQRGGAWQCDSRDSAAEVAGAHPLESRAAIRIQCNTLKSFICSQRTSRFVNLHHIVMDDQPADQGRGQARSQWNTRPPVASSGHGNDTYCSSRELTGDENSSITACVRYGTLVADAGLVLTFELVRLWCKAKRTCTDHILLACRWYDDDAKVKTGDDFSAAASGVASRRFTAGTGMNLHTGRSITASSSYLVDLLECFYGSVHWLALLIHHMCPGVSFW